MGNRSSASFPEAGQEESPRGIVAGAISIKNTGNENKEEPMFSPAAFVANPIASISPKTKHRSLPVQSTRPESTGIKTSLEELLSPALQSFFGANADRERTPASSESASVDMDNSAIEASKGECSESTSVDMDNATIEPNNGGCSESISVNETSSVTEDIEVPAGNCVTEGTDPVLVATNKRKLVVQELIQTEYDYVRDLEMIVTGYMAIMRDPESEIVMPEDLKNGRDRIVFGNLETIYEWHRDVFSKGLETCLEHPEQLGPLIKKYERKLRMYIVYCQNKPLSEYIVTEYMETYFEKIRLQLGHHLTLCDLLIKPVQRIMKYRLLLQDVLKYTKRIGKEEDVRMVKQACEIMHIVPKEANDMMNVGRLQGFDGRISAQGKLLLFGPLICAEAPSAAHLKGKELHVFFFATSIILSEAVSKSSNLSNPVYVYRDIIKVSRMKIVEKMDDGDPLKFKITSTDPDRSSSSYVFQAPEKETLDMWMAKLQDVLQAQHDFMRALIFPTRQQKRSLP